MLAALLLLCSLPRAWSAGEDAPAADAPVDDAPLGAPVAAPPPFPEAPRVFGPIGADRVWVRGADPGGGRPLDSLALDPQNPDVWLVADVSGAVFRSADAGSSWVMVLAGRRATAVDGEPDDEALLLEAESAVEEELDDVDAADPGRIDPTQGFDDALPEALDAAREAEAAADEAADRAREAGERAALREAAVFGAADTPVRVWFDPAVPQSAYVGRPDGVWRSTDGGRTWTVADDELGAAEFFRWKDVIVIGGSSGVRASVDGGRSFIDIEAATNGAVVYQFAAVGERLYAATSGGLFVSDDGLWWGWVAAAGADPIRTVVPDPGWPGGLWIAGERGLRRSDDGAASFFSSGTQPLRGMRRIVPLPTQGHLLAVGSDGVWESIDGGVRWQLASRLLTEPDVRDVALSRGLPVIATARGVWRLVDAEPMAEDRRPPPPRGLSLSETVAVATYRDGLDVAPVSLSGKALLARITPMLELQGGARMGQSRDSDYLLFQTQEAADVTWHATLRLCWGGCAGSVTTGADVTYTDAIYDTPVIDVDDLGAASAEDLADFGDGDVYILGGQLYRDDQVVAAAATVSQKLTEYRISLANRVGEAWMTRQRLAAETPLLASRPLAEQVAHLLQIQELDARLDGWTSGAWSQSLVPVPSESR